MKDSAEKIRQRLLAMTPEQKEEAMLRLFRFAFSDDHGRWQQKDADDFIEHLRKQRHKGDQ